MPVLVLLVRAPPVSAASVAPLNFVGIALNSSVYVFCTMLFVAIASRIYQPIVDRLNQLRA